MNLDAVISMHAAGNLADAEQGYRSFLSQGQSNCHALENLALICLVTGRANEAKELFDFALRLNPNNPITHLNLGVIHVEHGRMEDAFACYFRALELQPEYPEAYVNLGIAYYKLSNLDAAVSCFEKALQLRPDYPEARLNLGVIFYEQNMLGPAILEYKKAIKLRPDYPEAYNNLGNALKEIGQLELAVKSLRKAVKLYPNYSEAFLNLGIALQKQYKFDDAIAAYRQSIDLNPTPEACLNLGQSLVESTIFCSDRSRLSNAINSYLYAIQLKPDYAEAYNNLGRVLYEQGKFDDAVSAYQHAIDLKPGYWEPCNNMAMVRSDLGLIDDAVAWQQRALDLRCAHMDSRAPVRMLGKLLLELQKIPVIYRSSEEIEICRAVYSKNLIEASELVSRQRGGFAPDELAILRSIIYRITNFYLAYQQLNDKELQVAYANLVTEILRPEIGTFLKINRVRNFDPRIRIGIASERLGYHNGSYWAYNWLAKLPQADYQFFLYSLNGLVDDMTRKFAQLGTYRWLPCREDDYVGALNQIKQDNLDVLLLPDVGMGGAGKLISLARLAPIQCVGWGHPITTGGANVDYYLSSELMETADSDRHYSEQLVRLPNIGLHLDFPSQPQIAAARSDFGMPEDKVIFGSLQSLFKYLPQYDFVYPTIAKAVPEAYFVFIANKSEYVTSEFAVRLDNEFTKAGLNFERHVKIISEMTHESFMQLLGVLDVNLDSIGWTGGNSTIHALAMDCPVVTVPGEFMRGRHSCAMLKMIGVEELIAGSVDEYIALASRLGRDKPLRDYIVDKIQKQKHRLFNDNESVMFLDRFFKSKVTRF